MKWRRVWQCKGCGNISRGPSSPTSCSKCSLPVSEVNCRCCKHFNDNYITGKSCGLSLFGFDVLTSCSDYERKISE